MAETLNDSIHVETSCSACISGDVLTTCIWVLYIVLCQMINIFGIVTNIINIICFVKQGFKDSINISLLGLSISDLCSLITMAWTCTSFVFIVMGIDLPLDNMGFVYLVSGIPHFAFTRVSSVITAMITLERCLSISFPLKIKSIVTTKRTTVIILCIFAVFTLSAAPTYCVTRFEEQFSPSRNKTIIGIVFTKDREQVEKISLSINNFFIPLGSFVIIVTCTAIVAVQLRLKNKWRETVTSKSQVDKSTSRNQKVAKMVVLISSLFIICFIPMCTIMLVLAFIPDMSINGKYLGLAIVLGGFTHILESINSSMNIFIYHHMSAKYRDMCNQSFKRLARLL